MQNYYTEEVSERGKNFFNASPEGIASIYCKSNGIMLVSKQGQASLQSLSRN